MTGEDPEVTTPAQSAFCSIERALGIVGDRWSFLVLREALTNGVTKFSDFASRLNISPNILTARLEALTAAGVLEKREYRETGTRPRLSYHPTEAGRQLLVVLAALGQWGDTYIPPSGGVAQTRQVADTGVPVHVGFVEDESVLVPADDVRFEYTRAGARRMGFAD